MTVNEVIQRYPGTVTVFDRYGIDSCCGGGLVVSVAAERHGIDVRTLRDELTQAMGQAA
jgi:regulator of cell morphogenesis and NO signaling